MESSSLVLDSGFIRGGFPRAYEARILEPQDTWTLRSIAAVTGTDRFSKIDIEVCKGEKRLSRSFEGTVERSCIFTTPNESKVGVLTDSSAIFLIDSVSGSVEEIALATRPTCSVSDVTGARMFLATIIDVVAIGTEGELWTSRRVSLDGIAMLAYSEGRVQGIGIKSDSGPISFSIDASTGKADGGFHLRRLSPDKYFAP